ncbi:MAG: hypothetical protein WCR95_01690 [Eubacteriales bacterium]
MPASKRTLYERSLDKNLSINSAAVKELAANDIAQRAYLQGGFEMKYKLPAWSVFIERV